jgi:hypothetical protein
MHTGKRYRQLWGDASGAPALGSFVPSPRLGAPLVPHGDTPSLGELGYLSSSCVRCKPLRMASRIPRDRNDVGKCSRQVCRSQFGKCQLAVGTVGGITTDPNYWKHWWSAFYGHGPKLARAAKFARPLLPIGQVAMFIHLLSLALVGQRREVGFCVDLVGGRVVTPSDAISREEAADAIQCFGTVIDAYARVFSEVGLIAAFINTNADPDAKEMRAAIALRDPEQIRKTWEATTGFRPDDDRLEETMTMLETRANVGLRHCPGRPEVHRRFPRR